MSKRRTAREELEQEFPTLFPASSGGETRGKDPYSELIREFPEMFSEGTRLASMAGPSSGSLEIDAGGGNDMIASQSRAPMEEKRPDLARRIRDRGEDWPLSRRPGAAGAESWPDAYRLTSDLAGEWEFPKDLPVEEAEDFLRRREIDTGKDVDVGFLEESGRALLRGAPRLYSGLMQAGAAAAEIARPVELAATDIGRRIVGGTWNPSDTGTRAARDWFLERAEIENAQAERIGYADPRLADPRIREGLSPWQSAKLTMAEGLENVANNLFQMGTEILAPGKGIMLYMLQSTGESYQGDLARAKQTGEPLPEPGTDEWTRNALRHSLRGIAGGVLERMGLEELMRVSGPGGSLWKDLLTGTAAESITEVLEEASDLVLRKFISDQDVTNEEVIDTLYETAIGTILPSGGMKAGSMFASKMADAKRASKPMEQWTSDDLTAELATASDPAVRADVFAEMSDRERARIQEQREALKADPEGIIIPNTVEADPMQDPAVVRDMRQRVSEMTTEDLKAMYYGRETVLTDISRAAIHDEIIRREEDAERAALEPEVLGEARGNTAVEQASQEQVTEIRPTEPERPATAKVPEGLQERYQDWSAEDLEAIILEDAVSGDELAFVEQLYRQKVPAGNNAFWADEFVTARGEPDEGFDLPVDVPVVEAPTAKAPEAPAPVAEKKKPAKNPKRAGKKKAWASEHTPVLARIAEIGGVGRKSDAGFPGGEWDGIPSVAELGPFARVFRSKNGPGPDVIAQALFEEGLLSDSSTDLLYETVIRESKAAKKFEADLQAQEDIAEMQAEAEAREGEAVVAPAAVEAAPADMEASTKAGKPSINEAADAPYRKALEGIRASKKSYTEGGTLFVPAKDLEKILGKHGLSISAARSRPYEGIFSVGKRMSHISSGESIHAIHMRPSTDELVAATAGTATTPTAEPTPERKPVLGFTKLGENSSGLPVFEDKRGVRSIVEDGVRITEAVEVRPTRTGTEIGVDVSGRDDRFKTTEEVAQQKAAVETTAEPPATPTPSDYGVKNTLVSRERAEIVRKRLQAKFGELRVGFDPEMAALGMELAAYHIEAGARKFIDMAKAVSNDLGVDMNRLKPYLKGWYMGARGMMDGHGLTIEGMDDEAGVGSSMANLDAPQGDATDEKADAEIRAIIDNGLSSGAKSLQMRSLATKRGITTKEMQEAVEVEVVKMADEIVAAGKDQRETFDGILALYNRQPVMSKRTSTSIDLQAYSTPVPLSYLVGRMILAERATSAYEPTAGNGMLLIGIDKSTVTANELQDGRASALRSLGVKTVTQEDATTHSPGVKVDVVVTNPPFGKHSVVNIDGYAIRRLEHVIAIRALEAMKEDGRAVLILGANMEEGKVGAGADRVFVNYLMNNFNVAAHFEVAGELYAKQGAAWPVRVIVLDGVRKNKPAVAQNLAPETVERLKSWEEIYNKATGVRDEIEQGRVRDISERQSPVPDGTDTRTPEGHGFVPSESVGAGQETSGRVPGRRPAGDQRPRREPAVKAEPSSVVGPGVLDAEESTRDDNEPAGESGVVRDGERLAEQGERGVEVTEPTREGDRDGETGGPDASGLSRGKDLLGEKNASGQRTYIPASTGTGMGTLVPGNIAEGLAESLAGLRDRIGDVDAWLAEKIGYQSVEQMHEGLGAEQVDGVALAIDQIERGGALIIGDEAGIGKGRQAAAVMEWAKAQGHTPVFITVFPKLFTDMHGDITDIGKSSSPFAMSGDEDGDIRDKSGNVIRESWKEKRARDREFNRIREVGMKEAGYDSVFLPYSQIKTEGTQQQFLQSLANGDMGKVVFVLDEAHEASGEASTVGAFFRGGMVEKGSGANRRQVTFPGILNGSGVAGTLYMSATFAKRPSNMPLYFKTLLGKATQSADQLMKAMARGGVALQQAASGALAKAGQYIRRERDFSGVKFERKMIGSEREAEIVAQFDKVSSLLGGLRDFSNLVRDANEGATVQSDEQMAYTPFANIAHNYISQLLLSTKVDAVVSEAIAAHENGEKPVIVLMNTLETVMDDFVQQQGWEVGQEVEFTYKDILLRALDRTLRFSVGNAQGTKEIVIKSPAELGLEPQFNALRDRIIASDVDIPASPIDAILGGLRDAGIRVTEMTGRTSGIRYDRRGASTGSYERRQKASKNEVVAGFNGGSIDAILMNSAGSTGLSIHASPKFADSRPRAMIIAQPHADINIVVQTMGRIKRTGMLPGSARYVFPYLPLEAERRPAMVLERKLKSLNANTTASADSAVKVGGDADMLNKYGDAVVARYLFEEAADLGQAIGVEPNVNELGDPVPSGQDFAYKFLSRLVYVRNSVQKAAMDRITEMYQDHIQMMKDSGQYDLEIAVHDDWDAVKLSDEILSKGEDESNIFQASLRIQKWDVQDTRHAPTAREMQMEAEDNGVWDKGSFAESSKSHLQALEDSIKRSEARLEQHRKDLEKKEPGDARDSGVRFADKWENEIGENRERVRLMRAALSDLGGKMGRFVRVIKSDDGIFADGAIVKVKFPDIDRRFTASLASVEVTVLANIPGGRLRIKLRDMHGSAFELSTRSDITASNVDENRGTGRYERRVIAGNPIRAILAVGDSRGNLVSFKSREGETVMGLLMPMGWSESDLAQDPRLDLIDGAKALAWMKRYGRWTNLKNGDAVLEQDPRKGIVLSVPRARNTGGIFYLDAEIRGITGDFEQTGNRMKVKITSEQAFVDAMNRVQEIRESRWRPEKRRGVESEYINASNVAEINSDDSTQRQARIVGELQVVPSSDVTRVTRQARIGEGGEFVPSEFFERSPPDYTAEEIQRLDDILADMRDRKTALRAELDRLGLTDIALEVVPILGDSDRAPGHLAEYWNKMIRMSFEGTTKYTLHHEAIHALKDLGVLTAKEWEILTKRAAGVERIMKEVTSKYPDLNREGQAEEAVAVLLSEYGAGRQVHLSARPILKKLQSMFERLGNWFRGLGFQSADDVLMAINRGVVGGRERAVGEMGAGRAIREQAMAEGPPRFSLSSVKDWPDGFPRAFAHTTVGKVTGHPDFAAAKAGDYEAARRLVRDAVKPDRMDELARQFPGAIVMPVMEEEATGHNAIPRALADELGSRGLRVGQEIIQVSTVRRKGLDAVGRLLARKMFFGSVEGGAHYILVDDILTQGGTIHELRHFIDNNEGKVVAVSSLAFSTGSNIIAIKKETRDALIERFQREPLEAILRSYNIAGRIDALTESEAQAILRFSSLDAFRVRVAAAHSGIMEQGVTAAQPRSQAGVAAPAGDNSGKKGEARFSISNTKGAKDIALRLKTLDKQIEDAYSRGDDAAALRMEKEYEVLVDRMEDIETDTDDPTVGMTQQDIGIDADVTGAYLAYLRQGMTREEIASSLREVYTDHIPTENWKSVRALSDDEIIADAKRVTEARFSRISEADMRHADLEARAKAGDKAALAEAQKMVDEAGKANRGYGIATRMVNPQSLAPTEVANNGLFVEGLQESFADSPDNVAPIVITDDMRIVDGHHRVFAATEAGVDINAYVVPAWMFDAAKEDGFDNADFSAFVMEAVGDAEQAGRMQSFKQADKVMTFFDETPFIHDAQGKLIPLSQRFQTESPDIRYSRISDIPAPEGHDPKNLLHRVMEESGKKLTPQTIMERLKSFLPSKEAKEIGDMSTYAFVRSRSWWAAKKHKPIRAYVDAEIQRERDKNDMLARMLSLAEPFAALPKEERAAVEDLWIRGDIAGRDFKTTDPIMRGLSEKQVDGYIGVRAALDSVRNDMISELEAEIDGIREFADSIEGNEEKVARLEEEIAKHKSAIADLKRIRGYFPRSRDDGIHVSYTDADKHRHRRVFPNNAFGSEAVKVFTDDLKKKGYSESKDIEGTYDGGGYFVEIVKPRPEAMFEDMREMEVNALLGEALTGVSDSEQEAARETLRAILFTRGWRRHLMRRQSNRDGSVVTGYQKEDLGEVLIGYLSGYAGMKSKAKASREFRRILASVDPVQHSMVYKYLDSHIRDSLRVRGAADKVAGTMGAASFMWYLGGRFSSALVNNTQNFIIGVTTLAKAMRKAGVSNLGSEVKAAGFLTEAQAEAYAYLMSPENSVGLADDERAFLDGERMHIDTETQAREVGKRLAAKKGSWLRWTTEKAGWMYGVTERANRYAAALAYYRAMKGAITNKEDMRRGAHDFILDVHFPYTSWNEPMMFKNNDFMRMSKPLLWGLQTYNDNFFQALGKMDSRTALGWLAMMLLLRGVPLEDFWAMLYRKGLNRDMLKDAERAFGKIGADMISMGVLPRAAQIDLSGSLDVDLPPLLNLMATLTGIKAAAGWRDEGPFQSIFTGMANAATSGKIENFFPAAMKLPLQAMREAAEGVQGNSRLVKHKLSPLAIALRIPGLNPAERSRITKERWRSIAFNAQLRDQKRDLSDGYNDGKHTLSDIMEWNRELLSLKQLYGDFVTVEEIKSGYIKQRRNRK